ncbi:sensor histidine kinase [Streptomyces sp. NPDC001594]|uniref:sensor histidine kinase n=1 Tax=Streptomyces sp. NPDC001594 TaxID=3364590 RepID=UPI0036C9E176
MLAGFQQRALQRQSALRICLLLAAVAETALIRPTNMGAAQAVLVVYACYAVAMLALAWRKGPAPHVAWAVPLVDLPTVVVFFALTGRFVVPEWNSPFISDWLLLVVVLSAFQLRPVVTAVTGALATAFYGIDTTLALLDDTVSLRYTIGHTLTLALIGVGAVLLSRIQNARVHDIAGLAHARASMLATTLSIVERDRRDLAEALHDGPLQSVLAARLDVDEATDTGPSEALERADEALQDAARQLRSSVTTLHPSVLDQAGLAHALEGLAQRASQRGKFSVQVICNAPSAGTEPDQLLYNCAREFVVNVIKHARARHVVVRFEADRTWARLSVTDDGIGLSAGVLEERVSQGHIGIAAQQLRLQAVGGTLTVRPHSPTGTVVEVSLPLRDGPPPPAG